MTVAACGLLLYPADTSAQMMRPPSPNVTGIYAGTNYYPYRSGGYGPGYYFRQPYYVAPLNAAPALYHYYAPTVVSEPTTVVGPAMIEVRVPSNAEIWFDGEKTRQTGDSRTFVSPPLQAGHNFNYDIRARWTGADGKTVDQTRKVAVKSGERSIVDFVDR